MLPSQFTTQEEIYRKLRTVARLHIFENAQTICHIFYDVLKVTYYAIERKKKGIISNGNYPITLKRRDITTLVKLIDYHHSNDKTFTAEHELTQCFGASFTENDALKFFEEYVEGDTKDKFGRQIHIDLEDGIKFMYKNYDTNSHEIKSEYYLPYRGKRLPWIRHTLHHSTNIYTKIDGDQREIMYISKYALPDYEEDKNKCYWVVIVKKNRKDKVGPYHFKTAFAIFKYNNLLKRIERYDPVLYVPGA
jgi:hypothetical protein